MASFDDLTRKIDRLAATQSPQARRRLLSKVGMEAKNDYTDEVRADIGPDLVMSNWRRPPKKQVRFSARYKVLDDDRVVISPRPVGPFKVIDVGRSPGVSRRGRPVSRSRGFGTAGRAQRVIIENTPARVRKYMSINIQRAMR